MPCISSSVGKNGKKIKWKRSWRASSTVETWSIGDFCSISFSLLSAVSIPVSDVIVGRSGGGKDSVFPNFSAQGLISFSRIFSVANENYNMEPRMVWGDLMEPD